ncbi:MAG TPA: hypothetical protein VFN70_13805 [Burkholderiales bacterium]|nr:hypothetical protein [Burkholderiales bacterium]
MNGRRLRRWYWLATASLLAAALAGWDAGLWLVWRTFASPPVPGSVLGALGS